MEVNKSFKLTEFGSIPEDWVFEKIGNISSIKTGSKNTQDRIDDGKYPFFVRSAIVEHINSYSYDGEAVLTAGDGVGTGKIFHYINGKFDFHQRVYCIGSFNDSVDGYFFYLIFSSSFLKRIMSMTAKSSVDSVRMEMIANMSIPVPPKKEQTAIAQVLSDTDDLITNLEKLIEKKKLIKQGTMQQLLTGKKRLPGFSGEWENKKLNTICDVRDGTHESPRYFEDGIKFITSKNIVNGKLNFEEINFISRQDALEINKRSKVDEGDILMSMIGTIGNAILIDFPPDFCIKNVALIKPYPDKIFTPYLIQLLQSSIYQSYMKGKFSGGIQKFIALGVIRELDIPIPQAVNEQKAIAEVLSNMDSELELLQQKLNKYKSIKQGMMQNLLTGKIRLVKPELKN